MQPPHPNDILEKYIALCFRDHDENRTFKDDGEPDIVSKEGANGDVSDISASDIESEQGGDTDSISMNIGADNKQGPSSGSNQVDNEKEDNIKSQEDEEVPVQDETTTESNASETPSDPEMSNPIVDDERQKVCVRR